MPKLRSSFATAHEKLSEILTKTSDFKNPNDREFQSYRETAQYRLMLASVWEATGVEEARQIVAKAALSSSVGSATPTTTAPSTPASPRQVDQDGQTAQAAAHDKRAEQAEADASAAQAAPSEPSTPLKKTTPSEAGSGQKYGKLRSGCPVSEILRKSIKNGGRQGGRTRSRCCATWGTRTCSRSAWT